MRNKLPAIFPFFLCTSAFWTEQQISIIICLPHLWRGTGKHRKTNIFISCFLKFKISRLMCKNRFIYLSLFIFYEFWTDCAFFIIIVSLMQIDKYSLEACLEKIKLLIKTSLLLQETINRLQFSLRHRHRLIICNTAKKHQHLRPMW